MAKSLKDIEEEVILESKNVYLRPGEIEEENIAFQIASISARTTRRFLEIYEKENKTSL